jgi:hypothetical protein
MQDAIHPSPNQVVPYVCDNNGYGHESWLFPMHLKNQIAYKLIYNFSYTPIKRHKFTNSKIVDPLPDLYE